MNDSINCSCNYYESSNFMSQYKWQTIIKPNLFAFIYGLIFVFGIVFNVTIILIYTKKQGLKHFTKYFFINLSVSDIMVLSICIPRAICDQFTEGEWKLGYLYCRYIIKNLLFYFSNVFFY